MSEKSSKDILNDLREENKRLFEDLSFERNLNNILENIRNNSLILMENCKCITNRNTLKVLKQFNNIYNDLKVKQKLLKVSENNILVTKIKSIDANGSDFNTKTNSKNKSIRRKFVKDNYEEMTQTTNSLVQNNEMVNNDNQKFGLITEILNLKNKNNINSRQNSSNLTIIELPNDYSKINIKSEFKSISDHKSIEFKEENDFIEMIECEPTFDSLYSDNCQTDEEIDTNEMMSSTGVCYICGQDFNENREQLLKHLSNRHKIPSFECDLCEFKTYSESRLLKHKRIHSTDNTFICDVDTCEQTFRTEYKLNLHKMQIHSTDRRFSCHLCDYKASKKWNLDGHMSVHLVEKSIKCPFEGCDKWFANRQRLYEHKLYKHSPKRFERFACDWPLCHKVFRQKKTLKRHKKAVHSVDCSAIDVRPFTTETTILSNE